jgi:hypothetical protein
MPRDPRSVTLVSTTHAPPISVSDAVAYGDGVQSKPEGIAGATRITGLVAISESDYTALPVKDPQTVYVVTPDPAP